MLQVSDRTSSMRGASKGFHVGDDFDVDGNFFDVNVNFLFILMSDVDVNFMNCM